MHHQCQILLFHVVKVRVIPCVHGDLLPAEQHQQLPLLFSSIKIALRAVPICVHRCSSVYPLCGQNFKLSARCRLRAFPLRRGPSVPFWRSRARGRRGPSLQPRPPRKRRQSQGRPSAKWQTPCAALPAKLAAFCAAGFAFLVLQQHTEFIAADAVAVAAAGIGFLMQSAISARQTSPCKWP